jgi:hypothetical protein
VTLCVLAFVFARFLARNSTKAMKHDRRTAATAIVIPMNVELPPPVAADTPTAKRVPFDGGDGGSP